MRNDSWGGILTEQNTTTRLRLPGLDILRSLAVIAVLVLHMEDLWLKGATSPFPRILQMGWVGVDLFFVLSGFLIGSLAFRDFAAPGADWSTVTHFWFRRWARTLPLYYFCLLVYVFIKPLLGFPFSDKPLPYFFFAQNFLAPKDFVQSWSLCVEEHFYLVLPLIFWGLGKVRMPAWVWLLPLLVSLLWRYWVVQKLGPEGLRVPATSYDIRFPTSTHLDGLSVGVFLAATRERWLAWTRAQQAVLALGGGGLLLLCLLMIEPGIIDQSAIWAFSALALGFGALLPWFHGVQNLGKCAQFFFYWTAVLSYGIYLWNPLVYRAMERMSSPLLVQALFAWGLSFALAFATYTLVEAPVLRWRDRNK